MKLALEELGFGPCYHMAELIGDLSRLSLWENAAEGVCEWDGIFAGFPATVDYPACTYWRELTAFYPDAKVLLTVRDADEWFESTQATIFSAPMRARITGSPLQPFFDKAVWRDFGERIEDRDFMTDVFRRHREEAEQAIPPERLLVYEVGDGWEPLCEFLDVPVPSSPFPHANSRAEMQQMMATAFTAASDGNMERMSERVRHHMDELRSSASDPKR